MPEASVGDFVTLQRGQSYKGALLGQPGPVLLGLGTIQRNGGFRADNLKTYGGDSPDKILLRPGDLYVSLKDVTHSADLLGAIARVPESVPLGRLTQDTVRLDVDNMRIESDFLYWVLRSPQFRAYCRIRGTGTTNLDLSRTDFLSYQFVLPRRREQISIVELLGALDDKIAANIRLAGTLGTLADAHFAKALHGVELSDKTFAEVASISGGGTPSTKNEALWGGEINWATPTDITNLAVPYLETTARKITPEGLAACASALHPVGSILMTSRATIGAFAIAQAPTAVNQGFIVVNAHDPSAQWWLFHEMRSRVPEFISHANGATFLELSRGKFKQFRVHWPEASTMKEFDALATALHGRARSAALETAALAATRDALLPQLMSGRIRVRDAERVVEGVV